MVGEGGPWRQFFTDIARELQDPIFNCPLLLPSPNAVVRSGLLSSPERVRERVTIAFSPNRASIEIVLC